MNAKILGLRRNEYEGRLDPQFYLPKHRELEHAMEASRYPVATIGSADISVQVVDGPFGSDLKVDEYVDSGIPLIRVSDCRSGVIEDSTDMVFISDKKHKQLARSEILPGDVLLTKAGAILGYCAVFPESLVRGNITSHLASIRPANGVSPRFLREFLTSPIGNQQIYRWGNKSTRPELNTEEVRSIQIVLPGEEEQVEYVRRMDAARETRRTMLTNARNRLSDFDAIVLNIIEVSEPDRPKSVFAIRRKELTGVINPDRYRSLQLERQLGFENDLSVVGSLVDDRWSPETGAT